MDNTEKELYIIGAGGFGREVADTVREINKAASGSVAAPPIGDVAGDAITDSADIFAPHRSVDSFMNGPVYQVAGFIDDDESLWGKAVNDIEVKGGMDWLRVLTDDVEKVCAVLAIGAPDTKRTISQKLGGAIEWATIIHPSSIVSPYAEIGAGTIIQANVYIGPNVRIGKQCCINFCSGVGHDAAIGDYVSVMGHCDITGYDVIGNGVYVATSVAIIPSVTVAEGAFIGAGSVVLKDVPEGAKMFGCPARRVKS